MEIYLATKNKGKYETLKKDFDMLPFDLLLFETEIKEPRESDVSLIAANKAIEAFNILNEPVIAIDGGIYLSAYDNFPGSFTKYILEQINLDGILKLLEGKERKAYFKDAIAYMDRYYSKPIVCEYILQGEISSFVSKEEKYNMWSELAKVFVPDYENKPLSEIPYNEMMNLKENNPRSKFMIDAISKKFDKRVIEYDQYYKYGE